MNNNAIKRIQLPALIWLAIVLMFLPSAVVFAAPKPEGYIVDDAGLFSSSEISAIEDRIAQAPFDLYVYTVEHLDGTTIDRLSADTFKAWSLSSNDALVTIAYEEGEVYLELAINSKLERALFTSAEYSGTDSHLRLLMDTFFPHAANEDFGSAIAAVVDEFERLLEVYEAPAPQPAPSPGTTAPTPTPAPSQPPPASLPSAVAPVSGGLIFGIILGLFMLAVLAYMWVQHRRVKSDYHSAREAYRTSLGTVNRLEQELTPLVQLSRGQSAAYLKQLQDRYYELLQSSTQYRAEIEAFRIPIWVTSRTSAALDSIRRQIESYQQQADELLTEVQEYRARETALNEQLRLAKQTWQAASQTLTNLTQSFGFKLESLHRSSSQLEQLIDQYLDARTFDPLSIETQCLSLQNDWSNSYRRCKMQSKRLRNTGICQSGLQRLRRRSIAVSRMSS